MKVSDIKKNPGNPRQIKGEKLELLKASVGGFQKMMPLRPIVIDENNVVLGGNMRLAAIKALGLKEIPDEWVRRADDLSEDEKKEFIIKDNAGFGEWDWDVIANEWSDLPLADWGLDVPGFEEVEPAGEADAEPQIDKAAELNKKWGVVSGDLWQIGEHRLLCGDSTHAELKGDAVVTDPPYGIGWDGDYTRFQKNGIAESSTHYAPIEGDENPFDPSFLLGFDEVILWGANIYGQTLPVGSWLVWDKRSADGTAFLADAELAWQKGGYGVYIKSINQQSEKAISRDIAHPTKKPVALMQWCIERLKTKGTIIEPFAGSGTTLVACQNLNRKCYAIEISENYCAVILERMATAFPDIEIKRIDG